MFAQDGAWLIVSSNLVGDQEVLLFQRNGAILR